MSLDKAHLYEIIEEAARSVTNEDGRFEARRLREELATVLADAPIHVQALADELKVASLVSSFRRSRQPKIAEGQVLFDPGAIMPLGNGVSVWMGRATPQDVQAWLLLSSRNLAAVAKAEAIKQEYGASRLAEWHAHPGTLLGELERNVFGWTPTDSTDCGAIDDEMDVWENA